MSTTAQSAEFVVDNGGTRQHSDRDKAKNCAPCDRNITADQQGVAKLEKPATSKIATPALVATIKAHLAKGDQHYISAGLHLKELKARKPSEALGPNMSARLLISSRADQLIRISDGRTTIAKERAEQSVRESRFDERNRQARRLSSDDNADSQRDEPAPIADAGSPADVVKAIADRAAITQPKPVPERRASGRPRRGEQRHRRAGNEPRNQE